MNNSDINSQVLQRRLARIPVAERTFSRAVIEIENYAEECWEKEDKYSWHDLRKNPEDLPIQDVLVEVKFETGNYNHALYDYYDDCFWYRSVSKKDLRSKVILWRYIEPFEEDTE